jgi:hypothetical protein
MSARLAARLGEAPDGRSHSDRGTLVASRTSPVATFSPEAPLVPPGGASLCDSPNLTARKFRCRRGLRPKAAEIRVPHPRRRYVERSATLFALMLAASTEMRKLRQIASRRLRMAMSLLSTD